MRSKSIHAFKSLTFMFLNFRQLYRNNLSGSIPPALFRHAKLKFLGLENNPFLTGELPDVSGLVSVEIFNIYNCSLTGPAPSFQKTTNLRYLNLANNSLTSFPPELTNLTNLASLNLLNNNITGPLPDLPPSYRQRRTQDYYLRSV
ncbi:hypothetical protein Mapa_005732 [Marchantia paleacea]|nr:hypothetical protein Mapa_005732 [Marchantia paleacea]